jgi:hypothetical protein
MVNIGDEIVLPFLDGEVTAKVIMIALSEAQLELTLYHTSKATRWLSFWKIVDLEKLKKETGQK